MIQEFAANNNELIRLVSEWEPKLLALPNEILSSKRNIQDRTIKQIVGHMVDSASNNTHRIIHLQYQSSPLMFPDYANLGNNDRWIAIQDYQSENWPDLVRLWKYTNLHIVHVIQNVNQEKLDNVWITALNEKVTLKEMILDYLSHIRLHLDEINQLTDN